jgi:hypothetical protein
MKWSFAALGLVTLVIGLALRFRRSRSGTRGQCVDAILKSPEPTAQHATA